MEEIEHTTHRKFKAIMVFSTIKFELEENMMLLKNRGNPFIITNIM